MDPELMTHTPWRPRSNNDCNCNCCCDSNTSSAWRSCSSSSCCSNNNVVFHSNTAAACARAGRLTSTTLRRPLFSSGMLPLQQAHHGLVQGTSSSRPNPSRFHLTLSCLPPVGPASTTTDTATDAPGTCLQALSDHLQALNIRHTLIEQGVVAPREMRITARLSAAVASASVAADNLPAPRPTLMGTSLLAETSIPKAPLCAPDATTAARIPSVLWPMTQVGQRASSELGAGNADERPSLCLGHGDDFASDWARSKGGAASAAMVVPSAGDLLRIQAATEAAHASVCGQHRSSSATSATSTTSPNVSQPPCSTVPLAQTIGFSRLQLYR
jgi:hypothetical protein